MARLLDILALTKSYFSIASVALLTLVSTLLAGVRDQYIILALLAFFIFLTASLNSYNNLMDARADALTKKGFPIPSGAVSTEMATLVSASLYGVSIVLLGWLSTINPYAGLILAADLILSFLYSAPRIRLKRLPVLKGSVLVFHSLFAPFTAASVISGFNPLNISDRLATAFVMGMANHTLQDFGDMEGDRLLGDRTLPLMLGVRRCLYAVLAMYLLAMGLAALSTSSLQPFTLALLAAQAALTTPLLRDIRLWHIIFKVNAALSIATVVTIFYGCCPTV
ncbi:Protoheme IX farnesyltransferase [archaeon HR01]|nr:Protoheme IX farnesyltransferase [archaeon HR01]